MVFVCENDTYIIHYIHTMNALPAHEADEKFMANSHDDVGPSHSMSIGQN